MLVTFWLAIPGHADTIREPFPSIVAADSSPDANMAGTGQVQDIATFGNLLYVSKGSRICVYDVKSTGARGITCGPRLLSLVAGMSIYNNGVLVIAGREMYHLAYRATDQKLAILQRIALPGYGVAVFAEDDKVLVGISGVGLLTYEYTQNRGLYHIATFLVKPVIADASMSAGVVYIGTKCERGNESPWCGILAFRFDGTGAQYSARYSVGGGVDYIAVDAEKGVAVSKNRILVLDCKVDKISVRREMGGDSTPLFATDVEVRGTTAFLSYMDGRSSGVRVLDFSSTGEPSWVSSLPGRSVVRLRRYDDLLFIVDRDRGLSVYEVDNVNSPLLQTTVGNGLVPRDAKVFGDAEADASLVTAIDGESAISLIRISRTEQSVTVLDSIDLKSEVLDTDSIDEIFVASLANRDQGQMVIYRVRGESFGNVVGALNTIGYCERVIFIDRNTMLAIEATADGRELVAYSLSESNEMVALTRRAIPNGARDITTAGGYIFIAIPCDMFVPSRLLVWNVSEMLRGESRVEQILTISGEVCEARHDSASLTTQGQLMLFADGTATVTIFDVSRPSEVILSRKIWTPGASVVGTLALDHDFVAFGLRDATGRGFLIRLDPIVGQNGAADSYVEAVPASSPQSMISVSPDLAWIGGPGGTEFVDLSRGSMVLSDDIARKSAQGCWSCVFFPMLQSVLPRTQ